MSAAAARAYDALDALPRELWRWAVICSSGQADCRIPQLQRWREALREGALPDAALHFGDPEATGALRSLIGELELGTLARGSDAMTQQVLQSVLWHLDSLIDRGSAETRAAAIARMGDAFRENWATQRQGWEEVMALLQTMGDLAHLRWDELRGHLQAREWQEARRIGRLLQALPQLVAFIEGVGRRDAVPTAPAARRVEPREAPPRRQRRADQSVHDERLPEPASVDGVRRSRVIERMAGAEGINLRHRTLRRLWRARFAEGQLLTYDDRAPRPLPLEQPQQPPDAQDEARQPLGRGPLIVCLDTSGSMRGAPENVAKACVLQALRSAHRGQRACRLIAFGGPQELLERELDLGAGGIETLLAVMGQSFDGGTDVQTPIERAITTVRESAWRQADVLIVSDGEFGLTPEALARLHEAKATLGLRVHGILIGDRETIGLVEVCDQLHWVRDWRRYGAAGSAGAEGFSPVHSRSLTAMYFPNAIRRPGGL